MTALVAHGVHYGLLVAGLLTVAVLVLTVRRGRHDGHDGQHDERVRRLRDGVSSGAPSDDDPGARHPPSAG